MDETTKTLTLLTDAERALLAGKGIDIGCGPDPVRPDARRFDLRDGDANAIAAHVHETFDYVWSSHCLEHMRDVPGALAGWWSLVRPGGALFLVVPDEDLYEQGVWPSRFNGDHKATFTIAKARSWSPVSYNLLDLARTLPGADLQALRLMDQGYDRRLLRFGPRRPGPLARPLVSLYRRLRAATGLRLTLLEALEAQGRQVDQTTGEAVAQIFCLLRKT